MLSRSRRDDSVTLISLMLFVVGSSGMRRASATTSRSAAVAIASGTVRLRVSCCVENIDVTVIADAVELAYVLARFITSGGSLSR